jgi:signal transduction histidine kinase
MDAEPTVGRSRRRVSPLVRDAWLPALLAAVGTAEMLTLDVPHACAGAACEVVACALLVARRRAALLVAPLACVAVMAITWVGVPMDSPATTVGIIALIFFSLGRWTGSRAATLGAAAALMGVFATYVVADSRTHDISDVLFVAGLCTPPLVLGAVTRKLAEQKRALELHQDLVRREAVRDERDRIARELHDVIAHSVSAMVVQVSAAQELLDADPAHARRLLDSVAETGRRSLVETGRLLHVIRDVDGELGLTPAPGLADVDDLVQVFRAGGMRVDLETEPPLPQLDGGADVSAYRVVQEALTNAARYAPDGQVRLRLEGTDDGVRIAASNSADGRTGGGSGLGLVGMAERVALLGGSMRHGLVGEGRFELEVVLPGRAR